MSKNPLLLTPKRKPQKSPNFVLNLTGVDENMAWWGQREWNRTRARSYFPGLR